MNRQRGFTLIELVVFIVITGVALAAIGLQVQTNVQHSAEPLLREKAITLANFYMDEILRKKWNENSPIGGGCVETGTNACTNYCAALTFPACGSCSGTGGVCLPAANAAGIGVDGVETRASYDDIDDYNAISGEAPTDQTGTALTNFTGFTVDVEVNSGVQLHADVAAADTRQIIVRVHTPTSETITLRAYRVNF